MTLTLDFSRSQAAVRSLETWETQLSVPAKTLLHHASRGHFPVFVRPPLITSQFALFRTTPDARPLDIPSPLFVPKTELLGFVPDEAVLSDLIRSGKSNVAAFAELACKNLGWDSLRGLIPSAPYQVLRPDGWRLGAFQFVDALDEPEAEVSELTPIDGQAARQHGFVVTPDDLVIRDRDIEAFLESLHTHRFISDLFDNERFADPLPAYVSGKLSNIIEANTVLWRDFDHADREGIKRKRKGTREFLDDEFRSLCDKKATANTLTAFAAEVCDPSLVPSAKRRKTCVTPDLLALVTAAKLFWSPDWVDLKKPETHPSREIVESVLRLMGMNARNAAARGATVVRPEGAVAGKKVVSTHFFKPRVERSFFNNTQRASKPIA
ncbi:MAG: hypothetical protein O9303_08640 [Silanimonas sp.]|nr:hypothetical protein [Silanimonas sp.]